SIWGVLRAKTFDKDITIRVNCSADRGTPKEVQATKVVPSQPYTVSMLDEQDVDCTFNRNTFEIGSHTVSLFVKFDFQTNSYQKVYMVDKNRAVALTREGIDILDHYGIRDKNPKAVYTSGPIMIGMDIRPSPLRLTQGTEEVFTLGITLKNQWTGKVVRINEVQIILPEYVQMQSLNCGGHEFTANGNTYTLTTPLSGFTSYKTIRCQVAVPGGTVQHILGETPISTQYFKASSKYVYEFEKRASISVKPTREQELTRATAPQITMGDIQMYRNDQKPANLLAVGTDKETKPEDLKWTIISQTNSLVASCIISRTELVCSSYNTEGTAQITLQVSDGINKVTKTFRIIVSDAKPGSNPSDPATPNQPGGTTPNPAECSVQNVINCDSSIYKRKFPDRADAPECISYCDYYVRCELLDQSYSCQCSLEECDSLGADCRKGMCPNQYCCTLDCCDDCSCPEGVCNRCDSCMWAADFGMCVET
ncbi:MAG: hypothetical protein ABIF10_02185, partial [Candidatus Woesearchaeota archaeon]